VRFPTDPFWPAALPSVALIALLAAGLAAQGDGSGVVANDAEIKRAVSVVQADPNLATEQTIKVLRWRNPTAPRTTAPASMEWLTGLGRWLDQSTRVLMWILLALGAGAIAGFLVKALNERAPITLVSSGRSVPTHVQELDIRPETLPDDVGLAARQLWDHGDHRAALALLYRGLLSRLAHVHQLPIRDSSTEGDCLALAVRIGTRGAAYSERLISTWQAFVYGSAATETFVVHGLCDEFSVSLDGLPASPAGDTA